MLKSTSLFLRQLGFTGPGVLINEQQARANIRAMAEKAQKAGAIFRPHFKTHQSADVGRWFADQGVSCITVSSVTMAEYFADHGWDDITIALLLNPLQWPRVEVLANKLADRGGSLAITIDSPSMAASVAQRPNLPLSVWIKVDTGYGRTGVPWQDQSCLQTIVDNLGNLCPAKGLLTHSGNSYNAKSPNDLVSIWDVTVARLKSLAQSVVSPQELLFSVGDTPSCRFLPDLPGVHEIRPGNFVFFDLMQFSKGVCQQNELAAAAVCPVVGLYRHRNQIVIHGGATHLSREYLVGDDGQPVFGYLGKLSMGPDSQIQQKVLHTAPVTALSQEHGTISISDHLCGIFLDNLEIGDLLLVWPVHSCLTCDLAGEYRTLTGVILDKI